MNRKKHYNFSRLIAWLCILTLGLNLTACSRTAANTDNNSEITSPLAEVVTLPEETTEEPSTAAPDVEINLLMIGDILAHEGIYESGFMPDGTLNYDHLFQNILTDTAATDINVVNQEVILGGTELGLSSYPCFNSPHEIGDAEVKAGFNVILGASNHPLDKGLAGIESCLNFWRTKHPDITVLGINQSEEDYNRINIYEKNGFKVALLNYTYGTNGIPLPDSKPYCVNLLDENKVVSDITHAKQMADMVVVFPHWGTEYSYTPDNNQQYWTNLFLENGVDVVLGDHPHVIEPVETLTREDGHQMVVFYSVGNFVSTQDEKPRMIGGMAKVSLVKNGTDGSCYIKEYSFSPIVTHVVFGIGQMTAYKLSDYTDSLAAVNWISSLNGCRDFSVAYCQNFCSMVLGEGYNQETSSLYVKLR